MYMLENQDKRTIFNKLYRNSINVFKYIISIVSRTLDVPLFDLLTVSIVSRLFVSDWCPSEHFT
jgi:hypothetical protein